MITGEIEEATEAKKEEKSGETAKTTGAIK